MQFRLPPNCTIDRSMDEFQGYVSVSRMLVHGGDMTISYNDFKWDKRYIGVVSLDLHGFTIFGRRAAYVFRLVCRKIIKNGSTGNNSALAFVTCYTSCVLWMRYGMLIEDRFVLLVNIFGSVLQASYVWVFILYSTKRYKTVRQMIGATCFLGAVYFYSIYEPDKALAAKYVGFFSCSVTVLFFASPLMLLTHVVKVKSTESLPFPIIVSSLIVSCQWFAYGCLIDDRFIQIPNFLGCVLSAFQLCFFLIYRNEQASEARLI